MLVNRKAEVKTTWTPFLVRKRVNDKMMGTWGGASMIADWDPMGMIVLSIRTSISIRVAGIVPVNQGYSPSRKRGDSRCRTRDIGGQL